MTNFLRALTVIGLGLFSVPHLSGAAEPIKEGTNVKPQVTPYLGVGVDSVHPGFSHHMRDSLGPQQGLIIEAVEAGSAAEKAGLKEHDILTTYDDQKLFSTEQLVKLIHTDRVGRDVMIGYIREGKQQKVQVKLGEMDAAHPHHQMQNRNGRSWTSSWSSPDGRPGASGSEWDSFDSLTLKKLKDNKFRAEVQYLDKEGKTKKHVFEGTREELQKAIESEKDMKPAERAHLLHSLGLRDTDDGTEFNPFWFGPAPWHHDRSAPGL